MDMKKNKERTFFDFVYTGRLIDSVTPTEEPDFKVKKADGEFEVSYGNTGVVISNSNTVNIKDFSDLAIPADFNSVTASGVSSFFDDAFLRFFEKYKHDCVFSMELCFDVNR